MFDLPLVTIEFEFDRTTYILREASSQAVKDYFVNLKDALKDSDKLTDVMSKLVGECVSVKGIKIGQQQALNIFTYRQLEKLFVKVLEISGIVKEAKEGKRSPKI